MHLLNGANLRRLIPGVAVAGVLAASYIVQAPSLASSNDVGYGYANNCGVKGDGMHDHGKACPNRPFPGKGKGVLNILAGLAPNTKTTSTTSGRGNDESTTGTNSTTSATSSSSDQQDPDATSVAHGKALGRGHGHGRGHTD